MSISDDLRAQAYASMLRERTVGPALVVTMAATDDAEESPSYRTDAVDRYTAQLLSLWTMLRAGDITASEYRQQVRAAFQKALGIVPESARAQVQALEDQAISRAMDLTASDDEPEDEQSSKPQRHSRAVMAAGLLWAAASLVKVYRKPPLAIWEWQSEDDPATCPECEALDGQQFTREEIPFWPAAGDFGENTACGPNCRCKLRNVANEKSDAPV